MDAFLNHQEGSRLGGIKSGETRRRKAKAEDPPYTFPYGLDPADDRAAPSMRPDFWVQARRN